LPVYTGSFRPERELAQADGLSPNGTWTLEIVDHGPADVGGAASSGGLASGPLVGRPPLSRPPRTASFGRSRRTVTARRNGTFTYAFTATPRAMGTATFTTDGAVAAAVRRRRLTFGRRAFTAAANGRVNVTVRLSRRNRAALRRLKRVRARVVVTIDGRRFTTRFTLRAPRRAP
jgi:hypothetical protein